MTDVDTVNTVATGTNEEVADWTILIYLSADNNLSEECVYALKQLREYRPSGRGAKAKVTVVALLDPVGRGIRARHVLVGKSGQDGNVDEDTLEEDVFGQVEDGEIDMADPLTLKDFLRIGIRLYPAEHYMVVLSGHAAGTHEGFFLRDEERPLSLIPSSLPPQLLRGVFTNSGIKAALKGKKIDILGFDACMMSMIEVCYQLHDIEILDLVVASEGFSLNAGWPYDNIVHAIKGGKTEPIEVAKAIVEENFDFYRDYFVGGLSTDLSVIRLSQISALKEKVDYLAELLTARLKEEKKAKLVEEDKRLRPYYEETGTDEVQDAVILAHWAAQAYNGEQCVDLYDFCYLLKERLCKIKDTDDLRDACEAVKKFIKPKEGKSQLVEISCYTGAAFQYSHGISIYFPWSKVNLAPNYDQFDFGNPKTSAWRKFLDLYVEATQRRPRMDGKIRLNEADSRSTPPYGKGPEGKIFSMRNPPSKFDRCFKCGGVKSPKGCNGHVGGGNGAAAGAEGAANEPRAGGARKSRGGRKQTSRK